MTDRNRRIVLAERPSGMVDERTVRLEETDVPAPGAGEALARVRYLSIDPTIRTWMDDAPGYLPPIAIGEVVRSGGVAEVLSSNCERYAPGDLLFGMTGWQDYVVADEAERALQPLPPGVSPTAALGVLGITGMTAYFGLTRRRPRRGGRCRGGLRRRGRDRLDGRTDREDQGCGDRGRHRGRRREVRVAGGRAGFRRGDRLQGRRTSRRACARSARRGSTCTSTTSEARSSNVCLGQLALRGRVVLCGAISSYNDRGRAAGPSNYASLIIRRGRMEGFIILDYFDRFPAAQAELAGWVAAGRVKAAEHIVEGLEHAPEALNLLFTRRQHRQGDRARMSPVAPQRCRRVAGRIAELVAATLSPAQRPRRARVA